MKKFKWYHLYFLFAALDIAIISASLMLQHQTLQSFNELLEKSEEISQKQTWIADLRSQLLDLNSYGNDVFQNRDVPKYENRFDASHKDLMGLMSKASDFDVDISEFGREVNRMKDAAKDVFKLLATDSEDIKTQRTNEENATASMALMDQKQALGMTTLASIEKDLQNYTKIILKDQLDVLHKRKDAEYVFVFFVTLAVLCILYFGKRMHHEFEEYNKKLQQNEERFRTIYEDSPDAYLIMELHDRGRISSCNKSTEVMLRGSKEQILGKTPDEVSPEYQPDGRLSSEKVAEKIKACIETGKENFEWLHQRLNGENFWAHVAVSVITIDKRDVLLVSWRDISDRKELEGDLKNSNSELEEFAYRTSHDLRSPLISSAGLLRVATQSLADNKLDTAQQSLNLAQKAVAKLLQLIEDILLLTKTKNTEEADVLVSLRPLIVDSKDKFVHMENFDRLRIDLDLHNDRPIRTKESRIRLIIENMISNAIKYQDTSEDDSFLRISTNIEDHDFVLTFEDNGLGIPEEQRENVFGMFKRFHNNVAFGSGLGLYMMNKSAAILGGKLTLEASRKGVIFKLALPHSNIKETV